MNLIEENIKSGMTSYIGKRFKGDAINGLKDEMVFDRIELAKIVSEFENAPVVNYSNSKEMVTIKKHIYTVHRNKAPIDKFKTVPHAQKKTEKQLFGTVTDLPTIQDKRTLSTKTGFNECVVDIFEKDSFVTMKDLFLITECSINIERKIVRDKTRQDKNTSILAAKRGGVKENQAKQQLKQIGTPRIYVKILKLKTTFKVHSDVTRYLTYVRVNLVYHKQYTQCYGKRVTKT